MGRRATAKATLRRAEPTGVPPSIAISKKPVRQLERAPLAWPHKAHWIALACLAVALRLIYLDHIPGINGDEAWAAFKIRQYFAGTRDSWMLVTPTHRYIPFLGLMTWACESLGPPSFGLMRLPGAICGVGLVVAGFFAARRVFSRDVAAWAVGTLIAVLPMHIAYTRMTGADMFVGLATLALVYCTLQGHWVAAVVTGFVVSIWVHPIISLLAPAPGLLIWYGVLPGWRASKAQKAAVFGVTVAILGAGAWKLFTRYAGRTSQLGIAEVLSIKNFCKFWSTLGNALSGGSSYFYFTGRLPEPAGMFFTITGLGLLGLVGYAAVTLWRKASLSVPHRTFAACCAASALVFYGVSPLQNNGIERYCLFLLVPVIFSLGLLAQHGGFSARSIVVATTLSAWVSVASFYGLLIRPMLAGASSHETYATNVVEPKAAAMAWIARDAAATEQKGPIAIVADSWWLYWPLAYLSSEMKRFRVFQAPGDGWGNEGGGYYLPGVQALQQVLEPGGYVVAFNDGRLTGLLSRSGMQACSQQRFFDMAGKPLMDAMRICPALGSVPPRL